MSALAVVVMTVKDNIGSASGLPLSRHDSHSPAKAKALPSFIEMRHFLFLPSRIGHSKKELTGTRQWRFLKASRNEGSLSADSALALKVGYLSFSSFDQCGTRPQRIKAHSRWPSASSRMTGTLLVGRTLPFLSDSAASSSRNRRLMSSRLSFSS